MSDKVAGSFSGELMFERARGLDKHQETKQMALT